MYEAVLIATALAATWMAAVAWVMQLIHYPAFRDISPERFADFHRRHTQALGVLVGVPMLVEGLGAILLVGLAPVGLTQILALVGLVLALVAIGWTAAISGPIHMKIEGRHDLKRIEQLCQTNLPRSIAWLGHAICLAAMLLS